MTLVKWPQQQAAKDGATMAGLVKEDTMARVKWPLHVQCTYSGLGKTATLAG